MDTTLLKDRTNKSTAGGAGSRLRIAFKKDLEIIPEPSVSNPAIVEDDFVFKTGKDWIDIWVDDKKSQLVEEANDVRYNNGYTGTLTAFSPGDNLILRQFINEGLVTEEVYVLLDSCKDKSTILIGKGECSPVTMKINYDSGASSADEKGFTLTFAIDQEGVSCEYQGVGAKSVVIMVDGSGGTIDASRGTATYRLMDGTNAEIVDLVNAVPGSLITIEFQASAEQQFIVNANAFQLTADARPDGNDATIVLQATTANSFAERWRSETGWL